MTFLYVIARRSDDEGLTCPVKVGISDNPMGRLSSIQTACPFPIGLVRVFECPNREIALEMERSFHRTRKDKCLFGEWFDFTPREAIVLVCMSFHVALNIHLKGDDELISDCLEMCGVRAAQRALQIDLDFAEQRR